MRLVARKIHELTIFGNAPTIGQNVGIPPLSPQKTPFYLELNPIGTELFYHLIVPGGPRRPTGTFYQRSHYKIEKIEKIKLSLKGLLYQNIKSQGSLES